MTDLRRRFCTLVAVSLVLASPGVQGQKPEPDQKPEPKKPSLALRATPPVGFTPLRVVAVVELREGTDDYAEFYCAAAEWEWGDGTISENSSDCDPYEPGKSTIRRRFTADHVFRQPGQYRVTFRLKQKTKSVAAVSTNVQVRGGIPDGFGR